MKLFQAYHLLIFFSLIATSIAKPKYAKPGCNDTCGNVKIPYPFGIGATCSINSWYIIDCKSSTPYLPALNLEVLKVNLDNQTVVVSTRTPKIYDCQNPVQNNSRAMSIDLSMSPFLFCKYHNIFVFDGCGNAAMMGDGRVLTGCSTFCLNDTISKRRNNCFGFSCCQTTIPHYLKSYNMSLTGGLGGDEGCGYMPSWWIQNHMLKEPILLKITMLIYVPVSLMWTFPYSTTLDLNEKYRAKVSDFGTSRFVSIEQTHLTMLVKGTFGYLDPEYFQSSQFPEKRDVYSFGVVLVELLTRERPISLTRFGENRSLATHFMLAMEEGRVMSIFDAVVIKESTRDELLSFANLAMRCLNLNGKHRPTMKEVA
ncbi:hypothetical protein E3N88_01489 [Mikania micrantha]|uniref:Protein kinase domain-containing protein n=1 Tax=Mikania micrantha TaxID=192012 RepID=A0A5N6Q1R1_9ASTR|nr:hypothetical protein E3N88_01489 [Mikania micrantha]